MCPPAAATSGGRCGKRSGRCRTFRRGSLASAPGDLLVVEAEDVDAGGPDIGVHDADAAARQRDGGREVGGEVGLAGPAPVRVNRNDLPHASNIAGVRDEVSHLLRGSLYSLGTGGKFTSVSAEGSGPGGAPACALSGRNAGPAFFSSCSKYAVADDPLVPGRSSSRDRPRPGVGRLPG